MKEIEIEWAIYQCQDSECFAYWLGLSGDDSYGKRCESCGKKWSPKEMNTGIVKAMVEEK